MKNSPNNWDHLKDSSYKVCLIGAKLDSGNMGVSALAASLVKLIKSNLQDADITLLISNRLSAPQELQVKPGEIISLAVVNYRLSPKAIIHEHILWIFILACLQRIIPFRKIRNKIIDSNLFLKTMNKADLIGDIRGGDSFSDIYGVSQLLIGSLPAIIALFLKKRLILLPQTYGPYNSIISKIIASFILKRAHRVISRDKAGLIFLQNILKPDTARNIKFCPDVAFMLDPIKPEHVIVNPPLSQIKDIPLFGLNVSGLMYIEGYGKNNAFGLTMDYRIFTQKLALAILNKTDAHILFVPHTFSPPIASDPDACLDVIKLLPDIYKDRIHIVAKEYDQSELKAIIGQCDFFVGSRMHACIAALSQEIPTVGVAYSKKFAGVFESVGMEDVVVDGRSVGAEEAVERVLKWFYERAMVKEKLREKISTAKDQILDIFQKILLEVRR